MVKGSGIFSFFCVGYCLKAVAVFRVADNLGSYVSCAFFRTAAADADIFFLKGFILELLLKEFFAVAVFSGYDYARGFFVQTANNTRTTGDPTGQLPRRALDWKNGLCLR